MRMFQVGHWWWETEVPLRSNDWGVMGHWTAAAGPSGASRPQSELSLLREGKWALSGVPTLPIAHG